MCCVIFIFYFCISLPGLPLYVEKILPSLPGAHLSVHGDCTSAALVETGPASPFSLTTKTYQDDGSPPASLVVHALERYNVSGPKFQSEDWLNPSLGYASQLSHTRGKKRRSRAEQKEKPLDPSAPLTRGQLKRLCRVESNLPDRIEPLQATPLVPAKHSLPAEVRDWPSNYPTQPVSVIDVEKLDELLVTHPDQARVQNTLNRLRFGADIGFRGPFTNTFQANCSSALEEPDKVDDVIKEGLSNGTVAGPYLQIPFPTCRVVPLQTAPKDQGKVRVIHNLSAPIGESVNNYTCAKDYPAKLPHPDDVPAMIAKYGTGTLISKLDVKSAYKLVPVRYKDWWVQVFFWKGAWFIEVALIFGGVSSVGLWDEVAYLLDWIVQDIVRPPMNDLDHYIDDFFAVGPGDSLLCQTLYNTLVGVCNFTGIPIHDPLLKPDKIHGPSTSSVVLGNEYNTVSMTMNVTETRRQKIIKAIDCQLINDKAVSYTVLSKLSGHIHSACAVIKLGRFNRSEICYSLCQSEKYGEVILSREAKLELRWWKEAVIASSLIPTPIVPKSWEEGDRMEVATDASSLIGCGAFCPPYWLMVIWPQKFKQKYGRKLTFLEFLPILAAVMTWPELFANKHVKFRVDNMGTIGAWRRGRSKDPFANSVLKNILLHAVRLGMNIDMQYIASKDNVEADAISRNEISHFRNAAPTARSDSSPVPEAFINLITCGEWDLFSPSAWSL